MGVFLQQCPELFQNLETSIEKNDGSATALAAHTLKSQLKYLGCEEEVGWLERIENAAELGSNSTEIAKLFEPLPAKMVLIFEELHHFLNE